jgi:hypothetical protein
MFTIRVEKRPESGNALKSQRPISVYRNGHDAQRLYQQLAECLSCNGNVATQQFRKAP